ncbi:hypothetical protein PKB_5620 [Pseudomonas knackmussii B13]|uniref:DUF484 domain-containing protein n=1 Tax=Pseudomonas knackmussii (strain DSM 6978 / CCUG 54928 / LMG 23759 / B13) TaxID=1301098 RepID=A0A024HPF0_PSEKB|nr:DUF484 family protein [Pseudomonas knackmussii]CDF86930.1 hypothetical protein PKB_5620 [Pseudomonas knackmussii B13]
MTEKNPENQAPLDAEQVAAYLRQHPEFFVAHDELIPEMRIPHDSGSAVSLVERQVRLLRERNIEMRHRLAQLMDVARDNDRLFEKTRRLVLDLLDATSLEDVVSTVEDSLRHEFQVPFVSLILFSDSNLPVGRSVSSAEAHQAIGGLLSGGKTVCGVLRPHELTFLFGEADGAAVGSAAVVSLSYQGLHGVLAIGSSDPQHYKSSLGTLFLGYVAEVLARVLPRFSTPLRSVR